MCILGGTAWLRQSARTPPQARIEEGLLVFFFDIPITRKVYLRMTIVGTVLVAIFFVDGNVLLLIGLARVRLIPDVDVDLFFSVCSGIWQRPFSAVSSIFPSGARSLFFDLSLYDSLRSLRDSVAPVRRREDTEGDGDASVKVQIDWLSGRPFSNAFRSC
jgi:hypothetical protein